MSDKTPCIVDVIDRMYSHQIRGSDGQPTMKRTAIRNGISFDFEDTSLNLRLTHDLDELAIIESFAELPVETVTRLLRDKPVYNFKLAVGHRDLAVLCDRLAERDDVIWAEPDGIMEPGSGGPTAPKFSNDPLVAQQWHIDMVGAPIAWGLPNGTGSNSVVVAVADTGIPVDAQGQLSHVDLKDGRIVLRANTADGAGFADDKGHGTHVTGIVGATSNNGIGICGVNWSSPLLIYKVDNSAGIIQNSFLAAALTDFMGYLSTNTSNGVLNMSISSPYAAQVLYDMCESVQTFNAQHSGSAQAVICCTVGNLGGDPARYPARYSADFPTSVVGVGATDQQDKLATFSNRGQGTTVLAPGVDIYSTTKDGNYGLKSGTSMACPLVTGLLSLVWSLDPSLSAAEAIKKLTDNTMPIGDGPLPNAIWGYGRVTALAMTRYFARRLQVESGNVSNPPVTLGFNIYNILT